MVGVGQRIGNYRVQRKLGQGGMGAVYEAVHEEIGRRAAIKVLLQDFAADRQSIQRFFNEARAVNIIHHSSLVGVFESGRLEDGSAYIIMEYLDGELLSARLKRIGSLSHPATLSLGRQIASALAAAHGKGIVHRDLKPENVMVVADPETVDGERVKIFDFGLAKLRLTSLAPEGGGGSSFHTQSGAVLGTPTHMAPEQCRGASEVDGKADVYSLGVIMFQMLVGHTPFLAKSVGELMSMHLRDKPPNLRRIDKSIPTPLADLVATMLTKEPALRPDMLEIVQRLESLGAHRTRRGSAPTPGEPQAPVTGDIEFARTQAAPSPSGDPPISSQASGQATAPSATVEVSAGRQYMLAVGVAAVLVLGSAAYLFSEFLPSATPAVAPQRNVTWMIDSEPQGAELVLTDNSETLGRTPWYRTAAAREGSLRIQLRLAGYRDTMVIVNQSEQSNQKVSLEPVEKSSAPVPTPAPVPAPTQPLPPRSAPVVAGSAAATSRVPVAPAPRPAAAITVKRVRSMVASQPSGADVIRATDGKKLGRTPWTFEDVAREGTLQLIISMPGHISAGVDLDLQQASQQSVTLKRSAAAPKVSAPRPPARPPNRKDNIPYER